MLRDVCLCRDSVSGDDVERYNQRRRLCWALFIYIKGIGGGGVGLEHPQSSSLREQAVALLMIAQYIIQYIDLLKIKGTFFFSISVCVCRQHCAGETPGTRPVLQSSALLCAVAQCRLAQCRLAQCFCVCLQAALRWGDPRNSSSASILCSALCSGSVPLGSVPLGSVPLGSVFLCVCRQLCAGGTPGTRPVLPSPALLRLLCHEDDAIVPTPTAFW